MASVDFEQVDVFASAPLTGNPAAVIFDADSFTEQHMLTVARWLNVSETAFLLSPTDHRADLRARIFSPGAELPFAGHPALGCVHAWLRHGGTPRDPGRVVMECELGLIDVRSQGERLAFKAPGLVRSGPVDDVTLVRVIAALGIAVRDVAHANWIDSGTGWIGVVLRSAEDVLEVRPDLVALGDLTVGILGPHPAGGVADFEARSFEPAWFVGEDPVSGGLNAAFAQWLVRAGLAPRSYTVRQGTARGSAGLVRVDTDDADDIWIGGRCTTVIQGRLTV